MDSQHRGFPFRWVLPFAQLVVCVVLLWPMRGILFFGIIDSIYSNAGSTPPWESKGVDVPVPPMTPDEQRRADAGAKLFDVRKTLPLALNIPVLIVELPYIVLSPAKRDWVPKGMPPEVWRDLSWPLAGTLFWWFLGKGVEALFAARRSLVRPPIHWIETTVAVIVFGSGLVALAGIITSTPDDRRDTEFMVLVAGAFLWGILATVTIAARLLQRRVAKRSASNAICG